MDDDILFAIRVLANDNNVYDEKVIENLLHEFMKNEQQDIEQFVEYYLSTNNQTSDQESISDDDIQNNLISRRYQGRIYTHNQINASYFPHQIMFLRNYQINNNGIYNQINNNGIYELFNNPSSGLNSFIDIEPVHVALTTDALNKLHDISFDELCNKVPTIDQGEKCAICFLELSNDSDQYTYNRLPCNHIYHSTCIKTYLSEYDYHCPICKTECGEYEAKL